MVLAQSQQGQIQEGSREKKAGGFGTEPGQIQQDSGEGLGGFGTEPGQVRWETLVQSKIRFNRVLKKS